MVGPIILGSKNIVGTYKAYQDTSTSYPVRYSYTRDINGDGTDEIVFAGFETTGPGSGLYSNTNVEIYGWVNGKLQSITAQWLPNGTNQVQGVGDIGFGDFNGDGKVDMFLSSYTDREVPAEVYVMINKGSYFERVSLGSEKFQHGVAVGDINKDGYDDVYAPSYPTTLIYWGGPNGMTKSATTGAYGGGMGAVLGDFLGNGTVSVMVTDNDASTARDNNLFSIAITNGVATLTKVSSLPQPLLTNTSTSTGSHDVRIKSLDFNNDGKLDVILFSRATSPTGWPELSRIQFYKNTGAGTFEDVTSTVLSGYNIDSNVSYSPVFNDFNGDGRIDIFSSESSFGDVHDSTTMLIQQADGTFVDTARSILSSAVSQYGGLATVAKGPNGNYYVVTAYEEVWKSGVPTIIAEQQITWLTTVVKTPVVVATYALSSGSISVNEGTTATFTLTTTNVASGTAVPYTLSGINASDITGGALTGSAIVNSSGVATITVNIVADSLTEGAKTLTATAGGASASTTINDTSTTPVPTYALSSSNASVNEGATVTFTLTTTNVAAGTSIPYTVSGVSAADVSGGSLSGNAVVNSSGNATISVTLVNDLLTEGAEALTITAGGATASTVVNDTSKSVPTYSLSSNSTSVNEGSTAIFTLTTTNVALGTSIPYTLSGINAIDVSGGVLSGNVVVNSSGVATISVTLLNDLQTEGSETLTVTAGGASVATTINDTSTTPVPTYALSSGSTNVNEGATATFSLTTTNVASGTSVPYTLSGISADDIIGGLLTGSATVNSSGVATISVGIVADSLTEGTETLTVTAQSKTASITIADTSTTPVVITPVVTAPVVTTVVTTIVVPTFDVAVSNKPWGSLYQAFNAGNPGHSNQQTGATISLSGYLQVSETINGNGANGVLKVTNNHIAIVLDDDCNSHFTKPNMPRISGVSKIELANGDNLVDLTSTRYSLGDITIVGGKDADIIWSSSGNDTLIGGLGKNTLYGGAGKDHFVFNVALNDTSTIMDFEHGIDHIDLDRAIFTKFTAGQSIDGNIAFGLDKQTANSFIVYDSGVVYYDADGAGGQSPVAVAKLIGAPTLTAADFLIL